MDKKPSILIADDSRMIRKILFDNLTQAGYKVIESENGDVALTLALEHKPDLIISDINMPVMDGFDFCWSVKKTETTRQIPFIFLTTRDEISDKVRGRNLGASEYINKPFEMETLLPIISRLLRDKTPPPAPRQMTAEEKKNASLSGELSKMPITELLQLFSLNEKSGKLHIKNAGVEGDIFFQEGNVVNAHLRNLIGTKALYRLLAIEEGQFAFEEGSFPVAVEMAKNTLKLLIEGLRHIDEMKPLHELFARKRFSIQFNPQLFTWGLQESTPTLCKLLSDISQTHSFEELLDLHEQTDLDTCKSLKLLLDRGILNIMGRS